MTNRRTSGFVGQGLVKAADLGLLRLAAIKALDHTRARQHGSVASAARGQCNDGGTAAMLSMPSALKAFVDALQPFLQRRGCLYVTLVDITCLRDGKAFRLTYERLGRAGGVDGGVRRGAGAAEGSRECRGGQGQTGEQQARGEGRHVAGASACRYRPSRRRAVASS